MRPATVEVEQRSSEAQQVLTTVYAIVLAAADRELRLQPQARQALLTLLHRQIAALESLNSVEEESLTN